MLMLHPGIGPCTGFWANGVGSTLMYARKTQMERKVLTNVKYILKILKMSLYYDGV